MRVPFGYWVSTLNLCCFSIQLLLLNLVSSSVPTPEWQKSGSRVSPANNNVQKLLDSGIIEKNADMFLHPIDLIKNKGYPAEQYEVTTEDGYILELHRIPSSPKTKSGNDEKRPPILVMHALLSSSADWVLGEPDKFCGYVLADNGFDVWLGNFRGNTYTKKHVNLSISDKDFWDFSYHEHGYYDLPALIDKVIKETGYSKIFYAGFSMGTLVFYTGMSTRTEYNDKIRAAFHFAPVAYLGNIASPLRLISPYMGVTGWILEHMGLNEFSPSNYLKSTILGKFLCDGVAPTTVICSNVLFLLCGYNSKQLNTTMLPILFGHTPAGTSTKNMVHFAQGINSNDVLQFDYGKEENRKRYGQETPPAYELEKITAPVILFYSDNDWLSATVDVNRLVNRLPNVAAKIKVADPEFNHLDYVYAIEAHKLVYPKVVLFKDML